MIKNKTAFHSSFILDILFIIKNQLTNFFIVHSFTNKVNSIFPFLTNFKSSYLIEALKFELL
jgi:hypothetical protein